MRPPLSSSQSPLSSVSACGENCARSLAPPLPTARGAAGAPLGLAKRETGRARSKEKKRFGGSVRAGADLQPPAGDGWRSLVEVRAGNAPPLGRPLARGSLGYPQLLSPLPLTLPRRAASGSEKRSSSMRQPPRQGRHHPPRDGSCKLAEDLSVPEGQVKSEQAPIRRPPSRGGPLHRSAPKRFFLFHRARRILFLSRTKREWGAHPCGNSPLRERRSPLR